MLPSYTLLALGLALFSSPVGSTSISKPRQQQQGAYPTTTIYEFSNPTWLENVAIRHNGQILAASISTPALVQVDPKKLLQPITVATIPDATSILGIVELDPDIFYVIAGNLSAVTADRLVFPSKIWKVDLTPLRTTTQGTVSQPSELKLVADLSNTTFLNTLTRISPKDNSAILISDSGAGHVLRLDVKTGISTVVISDATTRSMKQGVAGVTGIHTYGGELFYANFAEQQFFKVPISPKGKPIGPSTLITNGTLIDDFILSRDGKRAFAATNPQNSLIEIDISSKKFRTVLHALNATAAALGRTRDDHNSLYVVTGGGLNFPLNVPGVGGGQVIRVDL
ncbi:hypothetical protein BGAL_0358g00020 [Botrytis galanthina]|uniref:SMP-30/Gluconolactonase/LRE-like region domain-containing protein n=1 Tax=Botrytis galanthina TaxID=278940 RepID=A0A4S8R0Y9_9HELO|nr:hypothetical protein BGAL_0358g00020 [Botrytis galanthina]